MAKRNRGTTQAVINRRISECRGQGSSSNYKPWLQVQDVPSQGLATRILGWKTARVHHFLSNFELNYFYVLEWSPVVCDIREQYPLLPLEETIAIAQQRGIRHPEDPKTKEPVVMTTDFLLTVRLKIGVTDLARTVKSVKDLQSERTLEKLEIERRYWQLRDIDWGIVTEHEIPETLAKNVEWLHPFPGLFHSKRKDCMVKLITKKQERIYYRESTSNSRCLCLASRPSSPCWATSCTASVPSPVYPGDRGRQ